MYMYDSVQTNLWFICNFKWLDNIADRQIIVSAEVTWMETLAEQFI